MTILLMVVGILFYVQLENMHCNLKVAGMLNNQVSVYCIPTVREYLGTQGRRDIKVIR